MANYWFISTKYRRSSKLALFTFALAFVVILIGAYTRLTDAGLSCPDWPNCYGFLIAPHTSTQLQAAALKYPATEINIQKAWTEMTHRYFAGMEGVLIIVLALSILLNQKATDNRSLLIGIGLIILLATQVTLGMLTVTEKLYPGVVLAHLLVGVSILAMLWWGYLNLNVHDDSFVQPSHHLKLSRLKVWLWIGFIVLCMQVSLGGWVSTHSAGLACIDLPYCNGSLLPPLDWRHLNNNLITIHMLHRLGAFITSCYLFLLSIILLRAPSFRLLGLLLILLMAVQVTLGILNILWLRPLWIALAHHGAAILLLLTMITALAKATFVARKKYDWV